MPKRNAASAPIAEPASSSSDLFPPPEEVAENVHAKPSPVKRRKNKQETVATEVAETHTVRSKRSSGRARSQRVEVEGKNVDVEEDIEKGAQNPSPKPKRRREVKQEVKSEEVQEDGNVIGKKTKQKRKTKEEKEAEAMPLAARTVGHKLYIGAHVSAAGGVHNAVANSVHIGANAFALFLKSQRKWANPPIIDEHSFSFHDNCKHHSYDQMKHVVPHGSYLVNLAHTDQTRTDQAYDSYVDDLKRCEKLGIKLYNIHPGNTVKNERAEAIAHLAKNINRAHSETESVITLLENMAAGGNVLGSTFEDLRDIIALVTNKDRIGVCIDTCHAFAGGYDLRSPAAFKSTMDQFEETVGFKYLHALHINDSKAPFGSHRDLHANIGTGFLGLRAFHNVVNEPRFEGLPLVLETPIEMRDENGVLMKNEKGKEKEDKGIWAREIKMLESLVGMDPDGEEFCKLEKTLARQGEPERKRLADQMERKKEKEEKKSKKGRKTKQESDDDSELSE